MFFHPCRDVCQAAWEPCSYRWIIWLEREIELCVISIAMVGEAMCLYDGTQWCSVCGEEEGSKNRSLGNPSDQLMCFGYLPSPGHPERPTSEIGLASSLLFWERNNETWLKTTRSSVLAMNGLRRTFDTKGKGDKVRSLIIEIRSQNCK